MSPSRLAEHGTWFVAVPRTLPNGIRWVVEWLFAWLSRYRRLNIVYERAADLFAGHIWIAMISIISRRIVAQTQVQ
jgi:hypothetical protein